MGKFSIASIMNEKSVEQIKEQRRVVPVPRDLIDPSEENHYSMNDIESLAASIEAVGLLDPLILRQKPNGRYAIISGHRRNAAIGLLAEDAPEAWALIDSFVIRTESDIHAEFMLIMANSQRVMTDADRVWQAERVKELLIALKASGFKFGRRMREEMAARMGTSSTNVARYEKISTDLVPELRQEFDAGRIGISQAYEYARKPADVQEALSKQRRAEKAPRPVKPPAEKTALVAGGMAHGISSAAKVESEICEAERARTREEIVIHVTAAVFGRLEIGAEVVFEDAGGKRFAAQLAQKGESDGKQILG